MLWKNCWKLPKWLRCRKAHNLQTVKDIDLKFQQHKLKTWMKIVWKFHVSIFYIFRVINIYNNNNIKISIIFSKIFPLLFSDKKIFLQNTMKYIITSRIGYVRSYTLVQFFLINNEYFLLVNIFVPFLDDQAPV